MTHTETQAMCERVLKMVADRASEARRMRQSFYAEDMDDVLALLTRQQEEIDAKDAAIEWMTKELDDVQSELRARMDERYD